MNRLKTKSNFFALNKSKIKINMKKIVSAKKWIKKIKGKKKSKEISFSSNNEDSDISNCAVEVDKESNSSDEEIVLPLLTERAVDLLNEMISFLDEFSINEEGLYRKEGKYAERIDLIYFFKHEETPDFSLYDCHSISAVIKHVVREMYQPLIPISAYPSILECLGNDDEVVAAIEKAFHIMKEPPRRLLSIILPHLLKVSNSKLSKMSIKSISATIGIHFARPNGSEEIPIQEIEDRKQVASILIQHCGSWPYECHTEMNLKVIPDNITELNSEKEIALCSVKVEWNYPDVQYSENELQSKLGEFGTIEMIGINSKKNKAVVMFSNINGAIQAANAVFSDIIVKSNADLNPNIEINVASDEVIEVQNDIAEFSQESFDAQETNHLTRESTELINPEKLSFKKPTESIVVQDFEGDIEFDGDSDSTDTKMISKELELEEQAVKKHPTNSKFQSDSDNKNTPSFQNSNSQVHSLTTVDDDSNIASNFSKKICEIQTTPLQEPCSPNTTQTGVDSSDEIRLSSRNTQESGNTYIKNNDESKTPDLDANRINTKQTESDESDDAILGPSNSSISETAVIVDNENISKSLVKVNQNLDIVQHLPDEVRRPSIPNCESDVLELDEGNLKEKFVGQDQKSGQLMEETFPISTNPTDLSDLPGLKTSKSEMSFVINNACSNPNKMPSKTSSSESRNNNTDSELNCMDEPFETKPRERTKSDLSSSCSSGSEQIAQDAACVLENINNSSNNSNSSHDHIISKTEAEFSLLKSRHDQLLSDLHDIRSVVLISKDAIPRKRNNEVDASIDQLFKQLIQSVECVIDKAEGTEGLQKKPLVGLENILRIQMESKINILEAELHASHQMLRVREYQHKVESDQWSKEIISLRLISTETERMNSELRSDLRNCRSELACQVAHAASFRREASSLRERMKLLEYDIEQSKLEAIEAKKSLKDMEKVASHAQQRMELLKLEYDDKHQKFLEPSNPKDDGIIQQPSPVDELATMKLNMKNQLARQINQTKAALRAMTESDDYTKQIEIQQNQLSGLMVEISQRNSNLNTAMNTSRNHLAEIFPSYMRSIKSEHYITTQTEKDTSKSCSSANESLGIFECASEPLGKYQPISKKYSEWSKEQLSRKDNASVTEFGSKLNHASQSCKSFQSTITSIQL